MKEQPDDLDTDNWAYKSALYTEAGATCTRMSLGAMMGSKTECLGSLGGQDEQRVSLHYSDAQSFTTGRTMVFG